MSDLGTSYSSIDQSEREREREGEEGGGQEMEVGFRLWQWCMYAMWACIENACLFGGDASRLSDIDDGNINQIRDSIIL